MAATIAVFVTIVGVLDFSSELTRHMAGNMLWAYALLALTTAPPLVPNSALLVTAGVLAAHGRMDLGLVLLVVAGAATTGDMVIHRGGRAVRGPVLRRFYRGERRRRLLEWAAVRIQRHGVPFVVVCRFLPSGRLLGGVAAGVVGYPARRYLLGAGLAEALWATYSVGLGYVGGRATGNVFYAVVVGLGASLAVAGLGGLVQYALRRRSDHAETAGPPPPRAAGVAGSTRAAAGPPPPRPTGPTGPTGVAGVAGPAAGGTGAPVAASAPGPACPLRHAGRAVPYPGGAVTAAPGPRGPPGARVRRLPSPSRAPPATRARVVRRASVPVVPRPVARPLGAPAPHGVGVPERPPSLDGVRGRQQSVLAVRTHGLRPYSDVGRDVRVGPERPVGHPRTSPWAVGVTGAPCVLGTTRVVTGTRLSISCDGEPA